MAPETKHKTPEENFAQLKQCKTMDDARAFVATLNPVERIELYGVTTDLKLGTFYYPQTSPEQPAEQPKPTQEHVDKIYASLLEMVKAAKEEANNKGHKLQLVVGQVRPDRTCLMTTAMLVYICRRLGITEMGLETPPSGELMYRNRQTKFGLEEIQAQIKRMPQGRLLSEFGGETFTKQRKNLDFLTQLGTNIGMRSFSNDPNGLVDDLEQDNPKIRISREEAIRDVLDNVQEDCITINGVNRMSMLDYRAPGIHRVLISTAGSYANSKAAFPIPVFRDVTAITEDSEMAKKIGEGTRTGGSPLIHVPIEGTLLLARDAMQMAKQADVNVGEKLAPMQLFSPRGRQR